MQNCGRRYLIRNCHESSQCKVRDANVLMQLWPNCVFLSLIKVFFSSFKGLYFISHFVASGHTVFTRKRLPCSHCLVYVVIALADTSEVKLHCLEIFLLVGANSDSTHCGPEQQPIRSCSVRDQLLLSKLGLPNFERQSCNLATEVIVGRRYTRPFAVWCEEGIWSLWGYCKFIQMPDGNDGAGERPRNGNANGHDDGESNGKGAQNSGQSELGMDSNSSTRPQSAESIESLRRQSAENSRRQSPENSRRQSAESSRRQSSGVLNGSAELADSSSTRQDPVGGRLVMATSSSLEEPTTALQTPSASDLTRRLSVARPDPPEMVCYLLLMLISWLNLHFMLLQIRPNTWV